MVDPEKTQDVELTLISEMGSYQAKTDADDAGSERPLRYDMLGTVGQGAMGEILLARDQELRRKVAFKKIHTNMAANHKVLQRFLTEAQITAQLDHPNIVPIYSLEATPGGSIGYSMKLIQGKTFKDLIVEAREQLDSTGKVDEDHQRRTLIEHFLKVCDAMHYAHNKGVIHRDLKPANIMVGPYNEVYVMDWGIAKIMAKPEAEVDPEVVQMIHSDANEPQIERTQLGQVMGTPRYMSPQQAAGRNDTLDSRCDQFSLGLILFELVTLQPAFRTSGQIELLKRVLKAETEPIVAYQGQPRIAPELQAVIRKATAKKVDDRYATVADMADDLRRFLRGEAVAAQPDTPRQKALRWVGHHRELTLGLVLALALLGGGTIIWSLVQQQAALHRAQEHRQKLSHFLLEVGKRAQVIDARFMHFEALLERVVGSTVQILAEGSPRPVPVFTHLDFYNPQRQPPDLVKAPSYGLNISLAHMSYKISPGISRTQIEPLMQQLEPLRHTMRYIALATHSPEAPFLPKAEADALIRDKGVPLVWTYIGLEQGILANYPGNTGYADAYDARKRPWYKESLQQKGTRWLSPYIDASGRGFVMPCTLPMHDAQQRFLGVAGLEMTLDYIKLNFLEIKDLPGVTASYLINEKGQIVVSSDEKSQQFAAGILIDKARDLQPYSRPEVIEQLKKEGAGYYEFREGKTRRVLAYYPLRSVGWSYLVEADSSLLQGGTATH